MVDKEKIRENYCRRWAKRLGLALQKSRAKKFNFDDRGGYRIINLSNVIVSGEKYELDIDGVEEFLKGYEKSLQE